MIALNPLICIRKSFYSNSSLMSSIHPVFLITFSLLLMHGFKGKAQCIGSEDNELYFCNSISRPLLDKYLSRAAAYGYATEETNSDEMIDADIEMMQRIQPYWLGRVAGEWWAGENDNYEFARAQYIADRIHTEVSPYIILQAAIYEHIEQKISLYGDWKIQIPEEVKSTFHFPEYPGYTGFFEFNNMVFTGTDIPDMSRVETQMWFYYRATKYIDAGYEALHLGQFMVMNDNDPYNQSWSLLLSNIRNYASLKARRGIVFIDAHFVPSTCIINNPRDNDAPYAFDVWTMDGITFGAKSDKLLFDYISITMLPDEKLPLIQNLNNPYDGFDRLCTINKGECSLLGNGFGGKMPLDWGWTSEQSLSAPIVVEFDNGGAINFDCEGELTDENFICNADNDPQMETPEYFTWGFGGESVWFALQSSGYRNQFIAYAYERVHELDNNAFVRLNLRMPITYSAFPWPGIIYNANLSENNDETVIAFVWNNNFHFNYCDKEVISTEFNHGISRWNDIFDYREFADVNGDSLADIIGIKEGNVYVSLNNLNHFETSALWSEFVFLDNDISNEKEVYIGKFNKDAANDIIIFTNEGVQVLLPEVDTFTKSIFTDPSLGNDNYSPLKYFKSLSDFNGDGYTDIIVCGDDHCLIKYADGSSFTSISEGGDVWCNAFTYNKGWRETMHLRLIGDINGDGLSDIVGFKDDTVTIGMSTGTTFDIHTGLIGDFTNTNGWENSNSWRFLSDANGDGMDDLVGFGYFGVKVALSNGNAFEEPEYWMYNFGSSYEFGGWDKSIHEIRMSDINGDNMADIIGFGNNHTLIALSTGRSFYEPTEVNDFGYPNYLPKIHPRLISDLDKNGYKEIIAFGEMQTYALGCNPNEVDFTLSQMPTEAIEDGWMIQPNPVSDRMVVTFEKPSTGVVNIADFSGRTISKENTLKDTKYLEIYIDQSISSGFYVLEFIDNFGKRKCKLFIIENQ